MYYNAREITEQTTELTVLLTKLAGEVEDSPVVYEYIGLLRTTLEESKTFGKLHLANLPEYVQFLHRTREKARIFDREDPTSYFYIHAEEQQQQQNEAERKNGSKRKAPVLDIQEKKKKKKVNLKRRRRAL